MERGNEGPVPSSGVASAEPTYEVDVDNSPGIHRCLTFTEHSLPFFSRASG